ncbi:pseudouridine synthase [Methylocella sp.]|uniref:pseudouridine synthase n=1 Tax=Methylocella sp. TaxID=1978226 RepID=UPI003782EB03
MSSARKPPRPPFKGASKTSPSRSASIRKPRLAPLVGERTPAGAAPARDAPERIAKYIARAGVCSRRDAEALIAEGRVSLNGAVLTSPAVNVGPRDAVAVDGAPLAARARTRLFLLHKPRGLVTTERDPQARPTVFDHVRARFPDAPRLVSVGRLDINTEGLLLLTNDGGLARALELPSTGWVRRYRVRAKGEIDQGALDALRHGVSVEGVDYAQIEATLDRRQGANCWLTMSLREGKNREIKRVLEHLGLEVNRLIRVSFGPFQLADLAEGALEEVPTRVLRDQLGAKLAAAAGADFSAPLGDAPAPEAPRAREEPRRGARETARDGAPRASRGGARPARKDEERTPALTREVAARPRKHVSALREERAESARRVEEPRRRIERSATADRKGRAVAVERISMAKPPRAETATADGGRRDARPGEARRGRLKAGEARDAAPRGERRSGRRAPPGDGFKASARPGFKGGAKPSAAARGAGNEERAQAGRARETRREDARSQDARNQDARPFRARTPHAKGPGADKGEGARGERQRAPGKFSREPGKFSRGDGKPRGTGKPPRGKGGPPRGPRKPG